jgi:hypothetical protein
VFAPSLERLGFDSVLFPYNFVTMQNPYYAGRFNALDETCRERRVPVQTIKSIALRSWAGRPHSRATWYEPLEQQDDIDLSVWWAMSRPGAFLCSAADLGWLPKSRRGQPVYWVAGRRGDERTGSLDVGRAAVRLTGRTGHVSPGVVPVFAMPAESGMPDFCAKDRPRSRGDQGWRHAAMRAAGWQ